MGIEVAAGLAVSLVTAIVGQFGKLSGEVRSLIVLVLSAAVALVLAGQEITLQSYLAALAVVVSTAVVAQRITKSATKTRTEEVTPK